MTQPNERDKYFPLDLTDKERAREARIEMPTAIDLKELEIGDRISIVASDANPNHNRDANFILEVLLKEQPERYQKDRLRVTFRFYPGFFGFTFSDGKGGKANVRASKHLR